MKFSVSFILVISILFSSIGVKVNRHYCPKEGLLISFFKDHKKCQCKHQEKRACCHHKTKSTTLKKKGCCQEESTFFQLDYNYISQVQSLKFNPFEIWITPVYHYILPLESTKVNNRKKGNFINYFPLIPDKNIRIKIQSFII